MSCTCVTKRPTVIPLQLCEIILTYSFIVVIHCSFVLHYQMRIFVFCITLNSIVPLTGFNPETAFNNVKRQWSWRRLFSLCLLELVKLWCHKTQKQEKCAGTTKSNEDCFKACAQTVELQRWHVMIRHHFVCFYRAMLCIRVTSHGPVSVCLSVRHKSVFY